ncbi:DUF4062 domain-containing protein [Clostridium botulinum]|uniref:DUF4062 domain-containing protein n=1 Tax=Clostridium botulinum TaxID=1491 RepID=A0A6G4EDD3_CLOBO|nr:DUF4062 domain-containing protein [Clostridium botulinum]AUM91523.1 hypothetical protein RSJ5_09635 [Clostridium botulinum]NFB12922.1 DUF4062 domain-containing protein [Clostridium botulinum]NFH57852.1 DUF4062 domain-containing protein [Clostridium botulinum]NFH61185.1 DUF4062 domain-containing protein [Clostridium botulinum]NFJ87275.1 DUF4062 domain-containing protein [Clostridium botulinum]
MKPRIFISSTYYDLKYIRNNIERFIIQYGFEPVLFESGNVYFQPNKDLDMSCYNEVKQCHMMILLIGGRYGAPASEDNNQDYISNYEKNYISITRKEFREANESKIPIFIFIDKNVQAEYYTYIKNKDLYRQLVENDKFEFAHVDDIHVFEFIEEVKNIAFYAFEKYEDIEKYLINQWSSMFYEYLISLKEKNEANKILNTVSDLQNVSEKINDMVDSIGKKILDDSGEYENIIKTQNEKQIQFYSNKIVEKLFGENLIWSIEENTNTFEIAEILVDNLFDYEYPVLSDDKSEKIDLVRFWDKEYEEKIYENVIKKLKKFDSKLDISKNSIIEVLNTYLSKIKCTFNVNGSKEYFKAILEKEINDYLCIPF